MRRNTALLPLLLASISVACQQGADQAAPGKTVAKEIAKEVAKEVAEPEAPAPTDPSQVLLAGMAAYGAGDLDKALEGLDDEAEFGVVGDPQGPLKGKAALRARWELERKAFPDLKLVPTRVIDAGDVVAVQYVSHGTHKGEFMGMAPTDKQVGAEELMLVWFDKGLIRRALIVSDMAGFMAQLGAAPKDSPVPPVPALPTGAPELVRGAPDAAALATIKDWYATFSKDTYKDGIAKAAASDVVGHDAAMGQTLTGTEAMTKQVEGFFAAFPDYKTEEIQLWGAGAWTVALTKGTGTHKGDLGPLKATNKSASFHYAEICRTEGGKAKECWSYMNNAELLGQLGLMPSPGAPAVAQK